MQGRKARERRKKAKLQPARQVIVANYGFISLTREVSWKGKIAALGDHENLSQADVLKLHEANPNKPHFAKLNALALVWAHNRTLDCYLRGNSLDNSSLAMLQKPRCSSEAVGKVGDRWKKQGKFRRCSPQMGSQTEHKSQERR
jgi:hypothetical protein